VSVSRIALLALLALAIAVPQAALGQSSLPADADAWIITGHETCNEERLVVDRNIVVSAGAVLDLQGCALAMDSPAYNDTYFASKDEGLTLHIERGGLLRLQALPGRPASIERADSRYGYTIKSAGDLESIGLPETPNRIAGLEGAHEGQLALGGFQMRGGNATIRYTRFEENFGPGLFMLSGSRLNGDHVDFVSWGGLMVTRAAQVTLSNWTAHALNSPVSISLTPTAFSDCRISGERLGLFIAQSNLTIERCTVASNGTALSMTDANVSLASAEVTYRATGILDQHKSKGPAADNHLRIADTTILGSGANATSAIQANQGTVEVRNSRLSSAKSPVINVSLVRLTVSNSRLGGPSGIQATDPYSVDVQGTIGPSPLVTVWRNTVVKVRDSAGSPLAGVELGLREARGMTDADGQAVLHWRFLDAEAVTSLDFGQAVTLSVKAPDGSTAEKDVQAGSAYVEFALTSMPWWKSPRALVAAGVGVAAAVGLFAWSRRGRADP
jgi:hypothetical protein